MSHDAGGKSALSEMLGPLPEGAATAWIVDSAMRRTEVMYMTSAQVLAYAAEQIAADRARWVPLVDALGMAVRQNEHDMLMTGEELRACRAALDAIGPNESL